jgi:hypothetical protein
VFFKSLFYQKPPLSAPGFSHGGEKGVPYVGLGLGVPLPLDFAHGFP